MIQKIKMLVLSSAVALTFIATAIVPAVVFAAVTPDIRSNLCSGATNLKFNPTTGACDEIKADASSFNDALATIINIISVIVGVVAVIMIIYGGFRYITSGGTSEKVTTAKNTILYGIIGLIIVALAQVIVKFVLKQATTQVT